LGGGGFAPCEGIPAGYVLDVAEGMGGGFGAYIVILEMGSCGVEEMDQVRATALEG